MTEKLFTGTLNHNKNKKQKNFLLLYSLVCVGPGRKPECWFSHDAAQIFSNSHQICILSAPSYGLSHSITKLKMWSHFNMYGYLLCLFMAFLFALRIEKDVNNVFYADSKDHNLTWLVSRLI